MNIIEVLPLNLQRHVLSFIEPEDASPESTQECAQKVYALINQGSRQAVSEKLKTLAAKHPPFYDLPLDLQRHVLSFIEPEDASYREIRTCVQNVYALVSKNSAIAVREKLAQLQGPYEAAKKRHIEALENKYSAYKSNYECCLSRLRGIQNNPARLEDEFFGESDRKFMASFDPSMKPTLVDALFTGYRYAHCRSSQAVYTEEVGEDIQDIVRLMPNSLKYGFGSDRLRSYICPVGAAVMNNNIPVALIELLFQQGANPNATWKWDGSSTEVTVMYCLKRDYTGLEIDSHRRSALIKLFERYGASTTPSSQHN